ncbi:hypothetical protein ACL7DA_18005 [Bordetella pertussis]
MAGLERGDAALVDIEADHRAFLAELHGQRQPHVSEADNGQFHIINAQDKSPYQPCDGYGIVCSLNVFVAL